VCSWGTQLRGKLKAGLSGNCRQKSGLMTSTKTDTKAYTILENNVVLSLCYHYFCLQDAHNYSICLCVSNCTDQCYWWLDCCMDSHAVRSSESIGEAFFDFSWLILYQWWDPDEGSWQLNEIVNLNTHKPSLGMCTQTQWMFLYVEMQILKVCNAN